MSAEGLREALLRIRDEAVEEVEMRGIACAALRDTGPRPDSGIDAALPGHPSPDRGSGPWVLRLVCCGYDDGTERYETWGEAEAFRQDYISNAGGHDRTAILTADGPLDTSYHRRRVSRRRARLSTPRTETSETADTVRIGSKTYLAGSDDD